MTGRVLITDVAWGDIEIERAVLGLPAEDVVLAPSQDAEVLQRLAHNAEAIMTCFAQVSSAVIDAAPRLRVIARLGAGVDNIDLSAAERRGIEVTRVPDYCINEVSEHALALALALLRRVPEYGQGIRQGRWGVDPNLRVHRISGAKAAILGRGRIGTAVARRLEALGMTVVDEPDDAVLLSIHLPLTVQTAGLVDSAYLRRLRAGAVVVNTSRGGVLDLSAAVAALDAGQLSGLGLDVLPHEPIDRTDPLLGRPDVIVTPHVAFYSEESLTELRTRAARSVREVLDRPGQLGGAW